MTIYCNKCCVNVTGQPRVQLLAAMYKHNMNIYGEEKRFLLTGYPVGGGVSDNISAPSQPLLQSTEIPMFPERLKSKSKPMPRSSPLLFICPFGVQDSYTNRSYPQALSLSDVNLWGLCHHCLTQFSLSPS